MRAITQGHRTKSLELEQGREMALGGGSRMDSLRRGRMNRNLSDEKEARHKAKERTSSKASEVWKFNFFLSLLIFIYLATPGLRCGS